MRTSTLSSSLRCCLMPSALSGERRVPRALPGLGGELLRAAASSACLAAWRAAQGAAPRMPSRRLPAASAVSALAAGRARFLFAMAAGGGIDFRAWGATDLREAGGTDSRAAGATDLRAGAAGRMDFGARSEARPNCVVFARDFIDRLPITWCIRIIADAP